MSFPFSYKVTAFQSSVFWGGGGGERKRAMLIKEFEILWQCFQISSINFYSVAMVKPRADVNLGVGANMGVSSDDLTADSKFEFDCQDGSLSRGSNDFTAAVHMNEATTEKVMHQDFKNGRRTFII